MNPFLLLAAVFFFIYAVMSVRVVIQTPQDPQGREPTALRKTRYILRAVIQFAAGVWIGSLGFAAAWPPIAVAPFVVVAASAMLILSNVLRKQAISTEPPHESLRALLLETVRRRALSVARFSKTVSRTIAPEPSAWREVWAPFGISKQVFSLGTLLLGYVGLIVFSVLLAVFGAALSLTSIQGTHGALLKAVIGFNALFVVSIFTIASLCVVSALALLRRFGVIRFEIEVSKVMKLLAAWVGYGTLSGVIGAALSPMISTMFPQPIGPDAGGLLPSVLVNLPACGAVLGYLLGLFVAVLNLGRRASNLLYRNLLAPVVFALALVALYNLGLTPELLFHDVVTSKVNFTEFPYDVCSVSETDNRVQDNLLDPTWLMAVMAKCGSQTAISGKALVEFTLWGVGVFAGLRFTADFRSRARATGSSEQDEGLSAPDKVSVGSGRLSL